MKCPQECPWPSSPFSTPINVTPTKRKIRFTDSTVSLPRLFFFFFFFPLIQTQPNSFIPRAVFILSLPHPRTSPPLCQLPPSPNSGSPASWVILGFSGWLAISSTPRLHSEGSPTRFASGYTYLARPPLLPLTHHAPHAAQRPSSTSLDRTDLDWKVASYPSAQASPLGATESSLLVSPACLCSPAPKQRLFTCVNSY